MRILEPSSCWSLMAMVAKENGIPGQAGGER